MLAKEELQCQRKNCSPAVKKRKLSNDADSRVQLPTIACQDDLIGKRVSHLTTDQKGKPEWYNGTVICLKPSSDSELVIKYDGYETLYSFDYSELHDGLLELIAVEPEYALGKVILQKFYDEDEVDSWWEKGRIIDIKDDFTADVAGNDLENGNDIDDID